MDSEDDWVDSSTPTPWDTVDSIAKPSMSYSEQNNLPKGLVLQHFMDNGNCVVLNRCEPVNKMYPTVVFPPAFQKFNNVLLSLVLFHHNGGNVLVRHPDLKDKIGLHRNKYGVFINPSCGEIRMKKKAVDKKTNQDLAFRLSADFKFHTKGVEPSFMFVATPFENGGYLSEQSICSKQFFVRSKRQDRHCATSNKRRKRSDIDKMITDIESTQRQLDLLMTLNRRLGCQNNTSCGLVKQLQRSLRQMPVGTTKLALEHAFRTVEIVKNSVSL